MDLFILRTWITARVARDERGAAMVEYGLLLTLIVVAAIVAVRTFGENFGAKMSSVTSQVDNTP